MPDFFNSHVPSLEVGIKVFMFKVLAYPYWIFQKFPTDIKTLQFTDALL